MFKNTCKNIALVVLVLLMGVLTVLAWSVGLLAGGNVAGMSTLTQFQALLPLGDGGYVRRASETAAAYPVRIAMSSDDGLVGAVAASAAASAFGQLSRSIQMPADGRTLEDVVRELLRPLLKQWLDENLPDIVQQTVDREVERIARGGVR